MNFKEHFWSIYHSPTAFRGWKSLLTGLKVGMIMSMTHGFVMASFGFLVMLISEDRAIRELLSQGNIGDILVFSSLLGFFVSASIFAPFHMIGLFDGARWRGYLDQIVTTGINPFYYISGRLLTGLSILVLMAFSMLPYIVFGESIGSIHWFRFLYGMALILLWGFTLMVLFVAISVNVHEIMSLLVVLASSFFLAILGLIPLPSIWGGLTPIRYIIQPLALESAKMSSFSDALLFQSLYGNALLGELSIPLILYTPLVSILIILVCYRVLYAGPRHHFIPGLNNFGVVVLPGDHKKKGFWRLRWNVKRQIDRIFFFENVPSILSIEEKEKYRRGTRFLLINIFCVLVIFGGLGRFWIYTPSSGMSAREFIDIRFAVFIVANLLYLGLSLRSRNELLASGKKWNSWDNYLEFCYYYFLPIFLFVLFIHSVPYLHILTKPLRGYRGGHLDWQMAILQLVLCFPYVLSVYLFSRIVSTYTYSKLIVGQLLAAFVFLTILLPLLAAVIFEEVTRNNIREEYFAPLYPIAPDRYGDLKINEVTIAVSVAFLVLNFFFIVLLKSRVNSLEES